MTDWMLAVFVIALIGASTIIWSIVGLVRWVTERRRPEPPQARWGPGDVAVLIAAHNEEVVLADTLRHTATQVPIDQVFVISDGSSDRTAQLARDLGANVLELSPNRGKAGALLAGIEHFELESRFEFVLLLDADTHLSQDYCRTALEQVDSDEIVAVAGRASTLNPERVRGFVSRILVWYRQRLYTAVQYLQKYGQAAAGVNVVSIVPGFASLYRTSALSQINIAAPGLVIEDYNMTFEVHVKHLGRIAFHPEKAIAYTQDPDNIYEYSRQVQRWALGFWQTVRRHHPRPTLFWGSVGLLALETVVGSLLLLLWVPVTIVSIVSGVLVATGVDNGGGAQFILFLPPWILLLGLWVPDFVLTTVCAILDRRPRLLVYAVFFPFVRVLDASRTLRAAGRALLTSTDTGRWISPERRDESRVVQPTQA